VGALLRELRGKGLLDETVILFTADHGEAFGEEDLYCTHGEGLGEALLRVPLLLRIPGRRAAVRRDVVRQIDVLPTLLEVLDVSAPAPASGGESLLRASGDRPVEAAAVNLRLGQSWRGLREDGLEIVQEEGGETRVQRRTARGVDPEPVAAEDAARLVAELERRAPWPDLEAPPQPDEEEEQALRALGYAE
jgi:arylsulfatase A-like enzyme